MLIGISQLATAAILAPPTALSDQSLAISSNRELELLAGIAYDILPFPQLPPELYIKAAEQILSLKDTDILAGLQRLRATGHNAAWMDLPEAERIATLSSVQDAPFFRAIRATTVQVLLREPATFVIVGYGGPSIQYGGYLNRGFNDIDWLPASPHK